MGYRDYAADGSYWRGRKHGLVYWVVRIKRVNGSYQWLEWLTKSRGTMLRRRPCRGCRSVPGRQDVPVDVAAAREALARIDAGDEPISLADLRKELGL